MDSAENIQRWQAYQKRTASGGPRKTLVESLEFVTEKRRALDIGAGNLNDSEYLLQQGFEEVIAVDFTPQFRTIEVPGKKFSYNQARFEDYEFPKEYFDLVSAQFSLPFVKGEDFSRVWNEIGSALKRGGIFAGQFFGIRDDWANDSDITFHSKEEASELVKNFGVVKFEEREYTEKEERQKHWHLFNLILRNTK